MKLEGEFSAHRYPSVPVCLESRWSSPGCIGHILHVPAPCQQKRAGIYTVVRHDAAALQASNGILCRSLCRNTKLHDKRGQSVPEEVTVT